MTALAAIGAAASAIALVLNVADGDAVWAAIMAVCLVINLSGIRGHA